jgi:hypothetical protein
VNLHDFPISPAGRGIRSDPGGDGHYGARRSKMKDGAVVHYKHRGMDSAGDSGQPVWAPVDGRIVRLWYPYADDLSWEGCVLQGVIFRLIVGYVQIYPELVGKHVHQRQIIGTLQDIGDRYENVTAHCHMEIIDIVKNPELFLETS